MHTDNIHSCLAQQAHSSITCLSFHNITKAYTIVFEKRKFHTSIRQSFLIQSSQAWLFKFTAVGISLAVSFSLSLASYFQKLTYLSHGCLVLYSKNSACFKKIRPVMTSF
jgi:hypothetical protein